MTAVFDKVVSASFRDARGETGVGSLEFPYDARYGLGSSFRYAVTEHERVVRHVLIREGESPLVLFAWVIEEVSLPAVVTPDATVRISGRGILCWLERATIDPPRGWRRRSLRERQFGFGANDVFQSGFGDGWGNSVAVAPASSGPPEFPGTFSPIWVAGQGTSPPPGQQGFFLKGWVESIGRRIRIDASGDDAVEVWIDGDKVIDLDGRDKADPGASMKATWRGIAAPGDHWIMVRGRQIDQDDMSDLGLAPGFQGPAWVAVRVAAVTTDDIDDIGTEIRRTDTTWQSTVIEPGWTVGFTIRLLIAEAQVRGVNIPYFITSFSDALDSNGDAFPNVISRSWPVNTDMLRFATDLTEFGVDIWMEPNRHLRVAMNRGVDRTGEGGVRLYPTHNLDHYRVVIKQKVRNRALVNTGDGWIEVLDSASIATHGRRETGLDLASVDSLIQANSQAQQVLTPLAWPQRQTDGNQTNLIPFTGAIPYQDFQLGDIVELPDGEGGFTAATVMALAWSLGEPDRWALEADLAQKGARRPARTETQRILTIAQSGGAASAGGTIQSATK